MDSFILVTGGAGFIGSHTCISLINSGFKPIILDDFSNSHPDILDRLEKITRFRLLLIKGNVLNFTLLTEIFSQFSIKAVLHFAGFKAVSESVLQPLKYYENNVNGTLCLLHAMQQAGVKSLVFSSSATVYGNKNSVPYVEESQRSPANPYGHSKMIIEDVLADLYQADPQWSIAILRYFNPVGAHNSGLIGEDPQGIPNNLMPCLAKVATRKQQTLNIFGNDYPTPDGTCVRDYIHVMDLAEGHVSALKAILRDPSYFPLNLGSGKGTSVLELTQLFAKVSSRPIPYQFVKRRPGDIAAYWANPSKAQRFLNWQVTRSLEQMCEDAWRWQQYSLSLALQKRQRLAA